MLRLSDRKLKKCRGIIVWDFDRVLFDTDRFIKDKARVFQEHGIPADTIRYVYEVMYRGITKTSGRPLSLSFLFELFRSQQVRLNEKKLRQAVRLLLVKYQYFDPQADKILHRLCKLGFLHIILSFGSAPFQYNKIRIGCGKKFLKHFSKIIVTTKPKYAVLQKVVEANKNMPIFFIDDVQEHIGLVRRHAPGVTAVHYSKKQTLEKIAQLIRRRVK